MPSWPSADRSVAYRDVFLPPRPSSLNRLCSGRRLRRALFLCVVAIPSAFAQQKPAPKPAAAHRANELTLAGLRPGSDPVSRAVAKYKKPLAVNSTENSYWWEDVCRVESLFLDVEKSGVVQTVRVSVHEKRTMADCDRLPPSPWKTGLGLRVRDSAARLTQLYGPPDSKSPSTRDGQPLELWYYAFDWAGPDVPQVMEVLCTREQDGKPGHVIEITLAAPSL